MSAHRESGGGTVRIAVHLLLAATLAGACIGCGDSPVAPEPSGGGGPAPPIEERDTVPEGPPGATATPAAAYVVLRMDGRTDSIMIRQPDTVLHVFVQARFHEALGAPAHDHFDLMASRPGHLIHARLAGRPREGAYRIGAFNAMDDPWPAPVDDAFSAMLTTVNGAQCFETRISSLAGELFVDSLRMPPRASPVDESGYVTGRFSFRARLIRRGGYHHTGGGTGLLPSSGCNYADDGTTEEANVSGTFRLPVAHRLDGHAEVEMIGPGGVTPPRRANVELWNDAGQQGSPLQGLRLEARPRRLDDGAHEVLTVRVDIAAGEAHPGATYAVEAVTPFVADGPEAHRPTVWASGFAGAVPSGLPPSLARVQTNWYATSGLLVIEHVDQRDDYRIVIGRLELEADVWEKRASGPIAEYARTGEQLRIRARFSAAVPH